MTEPTNTEPVVTTPAVDIPPETTPPVETAPQFEWQKDVKYPESAPTIEEPVVAPEVKPSEPLDQAALDQINANRDTLQTQLSEKGIDLSVLSKEVDTTGALSEASYKQLQEAGYSKEMVNLMLTGMQAEQERYYNAVISQAGGEEGFEAIRTFIQAEGEESRAAVNAVFASGNLQQVGLLIEGIQARMALKNGTSNKHLQGGASPVSDGGITPFATERDRSAAINDPRYMTDDKYRLEVQKRVLAAHK